MTLLLLLAAIVFVASAVLLVYRYAIIFPYIITSYVGLNYIINPKWVIKLGGVNVWFWDILLALALFNIFIRVFKEKIPIGKEARLLIFALASFVIWNEFSEFSHFFIDGERGLDNLVRTSVVNLYPLVALSIVLSLNENNFRLFVGFLTGVAALTAFTFLFKEVFDIGGARTSSGTVRRGEGESTLLLHLGLGVLLFAKKLSPLIRYPGVILMILGLVLLGHRSTFLGTALLLFIFLYFTLRQKVDSYKAIFWVPIGAFLGVSLISFIIFSTHPAVENFRTRLADTANVENKTSVGRLQKWSVAFKSLKDTPLGGTKLNGLPDYYGRYTLEADFGRYNIADAHEAFIFLGEANPWPPHNTLVNIVTKNGIIGLLCFLGVIFTAFFTLRFRDSRTRNCIIAILLSNFVFLIFNNHHRYATLTVLFICLVSLPIRLRMENNSGEDFGRKN